MPELINLPKYIGDKIRYYRTEKKLTQDELGEKIGVKKATISNYETGYRTPKQDTLFELANILGVKIDDLFPNPNDNSVEIENERPAIVGLINDIRKLNAEEQLKVHNYVKALINKKEEWMSSLL